MTEQQMLNALSDLLDTKLETVEQLAEVRDVATRAALIQENETLPKIQLMYESQKKYY